MGGGESFQDFDRIYTPDKFTGNLRLFKSFEYNLQGIMVLKAEL